eukprot:2256541-Ditylum_brightwellii.AAC.1
MMWDDRNEYLHGSESSYAKERQTALLTMRLKAVHSLYDKVLVTDWGYLIGNDKDIQQFATSNSPTFIQNWLNIYTPNVQTPPCFAE